MNSDWSISVIGLEKHVRGKTSNPPDKQRIIIPKTNPRVNAQKRKVLLKHYRVK
jgi:hypothetical protein